MTGSYSTPQRGNNNVSPVGLLHGEVTSELDCPPCAARKDAVVLKSCPREWSEARKRIRPRLREQENRVLRRTVA